MRTDRAPSDSGSVDGEVDEQWRAYIAAMREAEVVALTEEQQFLPDQTREFVDATIL